MSGTLRQKRQRHHVDFLLASQNLSLIEFRLHPDLLIRFGLLLTILNLEIALQLLELSTLAAMFWRRSARSRPTEDPHYVYYCKRLLFPNRHTVGGGNDRCWSVTRVQVAHSRMTRRRQWTGLIQWADLSISWKHAANLLISLPQCPYATVRHAYVTGGFAVCTRPRRKTFQQGA